MPNSSYQRTSPGVSRPPSRDATPSPATKYCHRARSVANLCTVRHESVAKTRCQRPLLTRHVCGMRMLKTGTHAFRPLRDATHNAHDFFQKILFKVGGGRERQGCFEVVIQIFVGLGSRGVGRRSEEFNLVQARPALLSGRLGVMHPQVTDDRENSERRRPGGNANPTNRLAIAKRLWLTSAALGLHLQPEMTPVIFRWYARSGSNFSIDPAIAAKAQTLAKRFEDVANAAESDDFSFFCRIGKSPVPLARSTRKNLTDLAVS